MNWPVEEIPNIDLLYYRIHKNDIRDGDVLPGAFRARGEGDEKGMSTDWNKYSTAQESKDRCNVPSDNAIIELNVGQVRKIELLSVNHFPIPANRSHSHVNGIPSGKQLKTKVRLKLLQIFNWSLPLINEEEE